MNNIPALIGTILKTSLQQILRWTHIGPLIGVTLASPVIWYFASPFDHTWRSLEDLAIALPIAYLIGIPAALVTGSLIQVVRKTVVESKRQYFLSVAIGALASTYLVWTILLGETLSTFFNYNWLPSVVLLSLIGAISTSVMLYLDKRRLTQN